MDENIFYLLVGLIVGLILGIGGTVVYIAMYLVKLYKEGLIKNEGIRNLGRYKKSRRKVKVGRSREDHQISRSFSSKSEDD